MSSYNATSEVQLQIMPLINHSKSVIDVSGSKHTSMPPGRPRKQTKSVRDYSADLGQSARCRQRRAVDGGLAWAPHGFGILAGGGEPAGKGACAGADQRGPRLLVGVAADFRCTRTLDGI